MFGVTFNFLGVETDEGLVVSGLFGISSTTDGTSGLLNDLTESSLTVNSFNLRST